MQRFIKNIGFFLLLILVYKLLIFACCYFSLPQENIQSSFYGKNDTELPSVLVVGASNLVYNYNFEWLNEQNKNYNFIGCNLNEPSGLFATLHKCKNLLPKENDILVLCLPYSFYESEKFLPFKSDRKIGFSRALLQKAFTSFPFYTMKNINDISLLDLGEITKQKEPTTDKQLQFEMTARQQTDSLYQSCWTTNEDKFNIKSTTFDKEYMMSMYRSLKTMFNCKIVFRFPVVKEGDYVLNEKRIKFMEEEFNCINKFEDSIYSNQYWYNQWYHLNACGAQLNTNKLLKELTKTLSQ